MVVLVVLRQHGSPRAPHGLYEGARLHTVEPWRTRQGYHALAAPATTSPARRRSR